jgi:hypothetical protein
MAVFTGSTVYRYHQCLHFQVSLVVLPHTYFVSYTGQMLSRISDVSVISSFVGLLFARPGWAGGAWGRETGTGTGTWSGRGGRDRGTERRVSGGFLSHFSPGAARRAPKGRVPRHARRAGRRRRRRRGRAAAAGVHAPLSHLLTRTVGRPPCGVQPREGVLCCGWPVW